MDRIYLDCAATTPMNETVLKAMLSYFGQDFGNPSSAHSKIVEKKNAPQTKEEENEKSGCRHERRGG